MDDPGDAAAGELWSVTTTGVDGDVIGVAVMANVHSRAACEPWPCWLHAPSDHHMREWPVVVRADKALLAERTCRHGIEHPDPDSLAYFARTAPALVTAYGSHACDGCCTRVEIDGQS